MAEKFYITTSIPYLNGAPHLGPALEYVQADIIARYKRSQGKEVFFLTGSDEHGAKIVRTAESLGKNPQDFVDGQLVKFQDLLRVLGISHDNFIRTSDQKQHWLGAQKLWQKLADAGDIYKGHYTGLYCVGHEAFITEKDLVNGICQDHQKPPEHIDEENYLFRLSKYAPKIREAIENGDFTILPESRQNETFQMLADAPDVSFSRPSKDISWGIPVPNDATQTMYVWCDALSNYLTGLGYGSSDENQFQKYWPADVHIIGKDVLRFHAVIWPAMLLSAGFPLPHRLFVHGWISVHGGKMSKSTGNVVDPIALVAKYGADAMRFYCASEIPSFGDADFAEERFKEIYDGLLVNGIGNLTSRTLKMISTFSSITKPTSEEEEKFPMPEIYKELVMIHGVQKSESMRAFVEEYMSAAQKNLENYDISATLRLVWSLFHAIDRYIEHYKIYKVLKENPNDAKIMLWHTAYALAAGAEFLKPFLPETAGKILRALGVENISKSSWNEFHVTETSHLFPRIEK